MRIKKINLKIYMKPCVLTVIIIALLITLFSCNTTAQNTGPDQGHCNEQTGGSGRTDDQQPGAHRRPLEHSGYLLTGEESIPCEYGLSC